MKQMDLKKYHEEIAYAICLQVNDCGRCVPDDNSPLQCRPIYCIGMQDVTKTSFCMDAWDDGINTELEHIAGQYDYKMERLYEKENDNSTVTGLMFTKKEGNNEK